MARSAPSSSSRGGRTESLPTNDEMNADAPKTALSKRRRLMQVAAWTAVVCLSVMGVCRLWRNQEVPSGSHEKSAVRAVAGGVGGFFGEAARGVPMVGRGGLGNELQGAGGGGGGGGGGDLGGPKHCQGKSGGVAAGGGAGMGQFAGG